MRKVTPKNLEKYIKKAAVSNVAKSTRRLFFNHLDESLESRGFFHVDQMWGAGSGILLRFKGDFFLLTAKHVIYNNINSEFQNESPFWILVKHSGGWSSLQDFLFPKKLWDIGELVFSKSDSVNYSDICLIELFHPQKSHMPDNFIEIFDKNSVFTKAGFFDGQFLLATGYPFERNFFDHKSQSEDITHTTRIQRHTIPGIYMTERNGDYISWKMTEGENQHKNVNGMSGGAIYNVQKKANQVKLAGLLVTAGGDKCRFIPSYIFIDAIINFRNSSSKTIDPIVDNLYFSRM